MILWQHQKWPMSSLKPIYVCRPTQPYRMRAVFYLSHHYQHVFPENSVLLLFLFSSPTLPVLFQDHTL